MSENFLQSHAWCDSQIDAESNGANYIFANKGNLGEILGTSLLPQIVLIFLINRLRAASLLSVMFEILYPRPIFS